MQRHIRPILWLCCALSGLLALAGTARADLLISNPGGGFGSSVKRYDSTTGAFLQSFGSGEELEGLVIGPNGNLHVAQNLIGFGGVDQYNTATGAFISTLVPAGLPDTVPFGVTFGPDNNVYLTSNQVGNFGSTGVIRYNGVTGALMSTFVPSGSGGLAQTYDVAFGPDGKLYVTDGGVAFAGSGVRRYDGTTGAFLDFLPMPNPGGMAFSGGRVYVSSGTGNSVQRFDVATGALIDTFVPSGSGGLSTPSDLAFGPDGNLYVMSRGNQSVLRYNGSTGAFIDTFVTTGSGGLTTPTFMIFTDVPEPASAVSACVLLVSALGSMRRRTQC